MVKATICDGTRTNGLYINEMARPYLNEQKGLFPKSLYQKTVRQQAKYPKLAKNPYVEGKVITLLSDYIHVFKVILLKL